MSTATPGFAVEPMKTILIVDDDPIFRSLLRDALSDTGLAVVEAADGIEALVCCRKIDPSLVLVDAVMPNMDGFTLCRELRQRDATRQTPILMVTGLQDHAAFDKACEAGATDFVIKPVDWGNLALRVRYVLRNAGTISDLRDEPPAGALELRTETAGLSLTAAARRIEEAGRTADKAPVSILVVDDDPILRTLTCGALLDEGYHVIEASDGGTAYTICQSEAPALIVSDLMMPGIDGFELCRLLRGRADTALVPILVVTGLNDHRSVAEAYDAGATDFIVKPVNWLILKYRIRYLLRAARTTAELVAAKERAEEEDQAKSMLLAHISRDLQMPLNVVIGFCDVMHRQVLGPLGERYASYAKIIGENGSRLLTVVNELADIARPRRKG